MANNLYQQLTTNDRQSNLDINTFKQNPQGVIQQMSQRNPNVASMMQEFKQSGMSAQDFFFKKVNEMGINPQSILNQLK